MHRKRDGSGKYGSCPGAVEDLAKEDDLKRVWDITVMKQRLRRAMRREVKSIREAVEVLDQLCIEWMTTNKIENSLWVKGTAFFDRSYCRVAYYDEVHNVLSIR